MYKSFIILLLLTVHSISLSMEDLRDNQTGCYAHPGMLRKDPVFKAVSISQFISTFNALSETEKIKRGKKPFINPADGHEFEFAQWLNDEQRAEIQRNLDIPLSYDK